MFSFYGADLFVVASTMKSDPLLFGVVGGIVVLLFGFVAYGIYAAFGPGGKDLRDTIDEHAKMHELGIAHGHGRKR